MSILPRWPLYRGVHNIEVSSKKESTVPDFFKVCLHGGGGPQISEVTSGESPHLSCKRDEIKMRD